ncbi:MAG: OmpH family outer membrane protein [Alistipes sp.]|nr:OmpH family outer membrane protein [Alistipes sp.]MBQ7297010.1 OmpH family outer membrane protein [Alistipes sp.]MBQ8471588.1 OmpH family outer membrane protein [Alistipes sp.]MBQ8916681.1 OmpH family outer membrane protein [Alistipes sp.]
MKQLIFTVALLLMGIAATAQNTIVVNSEKIFKSIAAYNTAIAELDKLAEQYQQQVDTKFAEVEELYNNYQSQRAQLSAATRQNFEQVILQKEQEATEFQESLFGQEGTLMKKRVELIKPIQERVFKAIEAYAKQVGAEVVIDSSNNPTLLYNTASVERTQQLIDSLK